MPSLRSDPYRQLQRLLRLEDVDDEVRAHVIANRAVLAPVLGARADQLEEAAQHEDFPRRLRRHLVGLRRGERAARAVEGGITASNVAAAVGASVSWRVGEAHLDVQLLLDAGLTAAAADHVRFEGNELDVAIAKKTLVDLRRHLPRFPDLGAYVDAGGLHLRWRGGLGQLNFRPQKCLPTATVVLLRRVVVRPAAARSRSFIGSVFAALGFNT
jgi:hypothetical protein